MRRRRIVWVAAFAVALVGFAAPSASASSVTSGQHCAVGLDAMASGGEAAPASTPEVRCFDSLAESLAFATGGRVRLEEGADRVSQERLLAAGAVSTAARATSRPLLGIEYSGSGYSGSSLALFGASGSGCYNGSTYVFPRMSAYGFDNVISSAATYSNCNGVHFQHNWLEGETKTCYSRCSTFGWMDNRTSSIRFWG